MKKPEAGSCYIRHIQESDFETLEDFFTRHEGTSLPHGYFDDFKFAIRDSSVIYFVAEANGKVVGGGGISDYIPCQHASLTFGLVDPDQCRKGFGTSLMIARFLFINPGIDGCQISLEATEWSSPFFSRLGFTWHDHGQDELGNTFLYGTHMVYPGDDQVFRRILNEGGVTFDDIAR